MNSFIKISLIVASVFIAGCKSGMDDKNIQVIHTDGNSGVVSGDFSGERYIWETWFFSTNRVNGVK